MWSPSEPAVLLSFPDFRVSSWQKTEGGKKRERERAHAPARREVRKMAEEQKILRLVSWNVNGLYSTLKDAASRYQSASYYFSDVLHADIVCFQEAKIQEEKLEKWMAFVPSYDSYWAFSQEKKGYSGVVTYVKEKLLPLDARADWLVTQDDDSDDEASTADLCKEGRIMYTDHGSFVLLNVYVPNAGGQIGQPRMDFKLRYLKALQKTCDALVRSGRHVVVVGDFNIAHRDIDVHSRWKIAEIYTVEEREWIDGFLNKYVDLYRHFHPYETNVFSVWDQKTEARIHNEGLRIDFAVCDKGFLPQVIDVDIMKMVPKKWSDHAAVVMVLKEQPSLGSHPAPALSSRNLKQFIDDPRQKKLTSLFSRGSGSQVSEPKERLCLAPLLVSEGEQLQFSKEGGEHSLEMVLQPLPSQNNDVTDSASAMARDNEFDSVLREQNTIQDRQCVVISQKDECVVRIPKVSAIGMKSRTGKGVPGNKRKGEPGTSTAGGKQRSLVSFFKAATGD